MNDDEAVQAIRSALRTLYPEPENANVDISAITAPPRRPHRSTQLLIAACVTSVVVLAMVLVHLAAPRKESPPLVAVGPPATPSPTSAVLTAPEPQPVIVGDRLSEPFSLSSGQIQLTPLPATYHPIISSTQAASLLSADSTGGWPGIAQPPIFLATLTIYSGPRSGPTPVWVSLVYVQQQLYGGQSPVGAHAKLPSIGLGDQVTTISAATGKFTSGINVAGPDPVAVTVSPRH